MKIVYFLLCSVTSAFILFLNFGCAPYLYQSYTESHSELMEKPECNDKISDSTLRLLAQNPLRSNSVIKQAILKKEPAFLDFFQTDTLFNKFDSIKFALSLSPDGRFSFLQIHKEIKLDSLRRLTISNIVKELKVDSIPNYPLYYQSPVLINRYNKLLRLSIPDSCDYYYGRSRKSIMSTVMLDLVYLRYAYNWRLRQKPGIKGRVTVKFAINEKGAVIFAKKMESTLNDPRLEDDIIRIVYKWQFCPINKPGDVTEVVYPFIFSK